MMEVLYPKCAGLDVHKDVVMACARIVESGKIQQEVRSFATTTSGLLALAEWLVDAGCTHVAMEATGVYWKPVWHVLEGSFELVLANAQHVRNVPGRKSDVNDSMWLADLLAHGLIRGSFVPPTPVQEMRDLTRTRKQIVREVVQHTQRIQKTLEDANIKLASVISDVLGTTGRAMLGALIAGEMDPAKLAALAHPRLEASREDLMEALRGRVTAHHRFLLKLHLEQIDSLQKAVRELEARMGDALEPFREQVDRLTTIPGVSDVVAQVIAAEVGLDMTRFPTAGHLISWAGLCPRMDESAGKRRSTRVRKGAPWLKTTLAQAAWSAVRKKTGYQRAQFQRLKARRGTKKAILAVAASMLTAVYHMLSRNAVLAPPDEHEQRTRARVLAEQLRGRQRPGRRTSGACPAAPCTRRCAPRRAASDPGGVKLIHLAA
jgi:transposase